MARTYKQIDALQIKWNSKNLFFDVLPSHYFRNVCKEKIIDHKMYWDTDDAEEYSVKAKMSVRGSRAIFDYIEMNDPKIEILEGKLINPNVALKR